MIKARIKVALNKRGAPSVNASKNKHYVVGQEVKIVDLINGDDVDGIDVWYKLDNGSYIWSGGVEGLTSIEDLGVELLKESDRILDLSKKFEIDKMPEKEGDGISIALLDSGICREDSALKAHIDEAQSKSFIGEGITNTHGTRIAGLVSSDDKELIGIARDTILLDLQTVDSNGFTDDEAVFNALTAINNGQINCQIISMSLDISDILFEEIKSVISKLIGSGHIIVVAGNSGSSNTLLSTIDGVISVAAIETFDLDQIQKGNSFTEISFFYLDRAISSSSFKTSTEGVKKSHDEISKSSAYTAITSGLIARYLSGNSISKSNRESSVKDFLSKSALPISSISEIEPFTLYKH